jgi:hypothetical protein
MPARGEINKGEYTHRSVAAGARIVGVRVRLVGFSAGQAVIRPLGRHIE